MKNIFSIAAICLVTTQAVSIKAKVESQVEGCCGGNKCSCLQYQQPNIDPCAASCNPYTCTSGDCNFSTGPDKTLLTYAGVQSIKESPFWQIIKECPAAMDAYQAYVEEVRGNEDEVQAT